MSKHLTEEQIARGLKRLDPTEEWLAVDEHVSQCAACRERLAQAWDLKAALQRSTGAVLSKASNSAAEHLTFEQLKAYVDGTLAAVEQQAMQAHTHVCSSCAEELRDLQAFRKKLVDSPSVIDWPVLLRVAAIIVVATLAAAAFFWVKETYPGSAPVALNNATTKPGNSSPSIPQPNTLAAEIASLQPDDQRAVRQAMEHGRIALPPDLAELRGNQEKLMGESLNDNQFQVLEPVGEVVISSRPIFRWRPLKGAQSYSVVVFDSKLNPVENSATLRGTSWNPNHALVPGRIYEWQVAAKTADGTSIIAPAPPSPEARFMVLAKLKADAIEQFQRSYPDDHLVLGILDAQAGALQAAAGELKQISPSDANYNLAQKLLASLQESRGIR